MPNNRAIFAAVGLLVAGVLIGVLVAALVDDDSTTETAGSPDTTTSTTTTTTTEPAPSTSDATTTTSTTTSTTTTSTTTTTTTTVPPEPPPVADATNGQIAGIPMGSPMIDVEVEMVARYGVPDTDTGWTTGCPLDGDPSLDERRIGWGNLRIRFADDQAGNQTVEGWEYRRGTAGNFDPDGPTPDDIVLHPGVAWGQSITDVGQVVGIPAVTLDDFGFTWVWQDLGFRYLAESTDPSALFNSVAWTPADLCE